MGIQFNFTGRFLQDLCSQILLGDSLLYLFVCLALISVAAVEASRISYTLASWITLWYEVYAEPRLREKTKDYYRNYIDNHIIPELGRWKS